MDLRQISVNFDQAQDRLLLQTLSATGSQGRAWLTRRLMLRLWPVLQQFVTQHGVFPLSPQATPTPEARRMLAETARSEAVRQADLVQPYAEEQVTARPLGAEPLLVVQVDIAGLPQGRCRLGLRRSDDQGFDLELGGEQFQVLMHLLEQALLASEWGVIAPAPAALAPPAGAPVPAALH